MKEPREEFLVIQKTYDLVKYLLPQLHKFPRMYRFTLGDRLENGVLDVLEQLIEARYEPQERLAMLRRVNVGLQRLHYLLRLAHEFHIVASKSYQFSSSLVSEVGRVAGSWRVKLSRA